MDLRRARRTAGLTQAEVARRMGTTQSAMSRAEAGWVEPSLGFLRRFSRAIGRPLTLKIDAGEPRVSEDERRRRVRRVIGDYVFDPWRRGPSPPERRSLASDGLTRERFESATSP